MIQQTDRDILAALKHETAEAHQQLDDYLALMGPVARDRYARTLASFRDAHAVVAVALEPYADQLAALGYDLAGRDKLPLIDDDLRFLGFEYSPVEPVEPFEVSTFGHAIGVVYVVEGATLGGQVIYRHVVPALGLTPPDGCRYFGGYGQMTGPRWKETQGTLTAFAAAATEPGAIDRAVEGATHAFRLFHGLAKARLEG